MIKDGVQIIPYTKLFNQVI